jgi:hypothetical protein
MDGRAKEEEEGEGAEEVIFFFTNIVIAEYS